MTRNPELPLDLLTMKPELPAAGSFAAAGIVAAGPVAAGNVAAGTVAAEGFDAAEGCDAGGANWPCNWD